MCVMFVFVKVVYTFTYIGVNVVVSMYLVNWLELFTLKAFPLNLLRGIVSGVHQCDVMHDFR